MALTVSARELRARVAEVLRAVSGGDTVTVTYRGRAVAEIRPVGDHAVEPPDVFGLWKSHRDTKEVRAWVRAGREARGGRSSSTRTS